MRFPQYRATRQTRTEAFVNKRVLLNRVFPLVTLVLLASCQESTSGSTTSVNATTADSETRTDTSSQQMDGGTADATVLTPCEWASQ